MDRNHFEKLFKSMSVNHKGSGYNIRLDWSNVGKKLDRAQLILDTQVWQDVQKYMPLRSGMLKSETNVLNQSAVGKVYLYPPQSDYGHYQYEGIVYVDPVYNIGAFYNPKENRFWSRRGVKKIPSDRHLKYTQPNAQEHWGEVAIKNHKKEWEELVKRALR